MIAGARAHGLDPERYGAAEIAAAVQAAQGGDRRALAHAEILLSRGYAAFVHDLHASNAAKKTKYVDDGLAPEPAPPGVALESAAAPGSLDDHIVAATRMNPLYDGLRRGFARWLAKRPPGAAGAAQEARIRLNLDRARAIPAHPGRYIIVDVASARLWMVDRRKVEGPMRVIVGKSAMETPAMAGLIRFAVLNPYWNVPPDLARERAKRVLREGIGWIARERFEILSDWGDRPRVLKPSQVDWRAVASGKVQLRIRQLPGGANVMGRVKFMMPNDLGIYLHDFPDKSLFRRSVRNLSSGCIRLEDAPRLSRWLFGGKAPEPSSTRPEQRVDLPEPVPVYISYFTALPDKAEGIAFQPDVYRRDGTAQARAR
jgi:murein L,D-transpeptidase YcbB/YkuD